MDRELLREWGRFSDSFFPKNSFNLFVQHKRTHQSTASGPAADHWGKAYFEYPITPHQQKRLEILENKIGRAGVVTYSAAAFMSKIDLFEHVKNRKLIKNSNFVRPSRLRDHSKYTFISPGQRGFANPEPEAIFDEPFLERIAQVETGERTLREIIKTAGAAVGEVMNEDSPNGTELYDNLVRATLGRISETDGEVPEFVKSLVQVLAFNAVNSTSWFVISPWKPE